MNKLTDFLKKNISKPAAVIFCIFAVSAVVKITAVFCTPFADFFNRYISSVGRTLLAYLTALFPFSVAETVIICIVPVSVLLIVYFIKTDVSAKRLTRYTFDVIAVIAFVAASFFLNYSVGYNATPLEDKMELEVSTPTSDELFNACAYTLTNANALENEFTRRSDGSSAITCSYSEIVGKLNDAYDKLDAEYDFLSPLRAPVKRIALSAPLTYTHMSGFYTFWSGEANVNINYPDYIIVYTTAHEMAHQRGIAPEDEANFIAFLACISADDEYIQYCGYTNLFDYLATSLYKADPEKYTKEILPYVGDGIRAEYISYGRMFEKYNNSTAAVVSDAVNNAFLQSQGQTEGTNSYGLVTDLAVAYLKARY